MLSTGAGPCFAALQVVLPACRHSRHCQMPEQAAACQVPASVPRQRLASCAQGQTNMAAAPQYACWAGCLERALLECHGSLSVAVVHVVTTCLAHAWRRDS
jgi:hypothetical protein